MSVWEQPISKLVAAGALWVPPKQKERLLRVYGSQGFLDFDKEWGFNDKIGAPYPTSFQSMIYFMNILAEEDDPEAQMQDQFDKFRYGDSISSRIMMDVFNLLQSCVRTRLGEHVWYT